MIIGGKNVSPPFEFWVPDYSDMNFPVKGNGSPFQDDPEDYDAYLDWLVDHIESNEFPLSEHHQEIISDRDLHAWGVGRLGLWVGGCSISEYYSFVEPLFVYPDDFLSRPDPTRVCDPATTDWPSEYFDEEDEIREGMISLETYLFFDCMCWQAEKLYRRKIDLLPPGTAIFSDAGWRPLLKVALNRTNNRLEKRKALKLFHDEYAYLASK